MTTPHRTLQMALDALYSGESPPNARQQAAITALREALAQPAPEPVAATYWGDDGYEHKERRKRSREGDDPRIDHLFNGFDNMIHNADDYSGGYLRAMRQEFGELMRDAAPPAAPAPAALLTGGALDMEETHPSYVAGFKAGHAAGRKRAPAVPLTDEQILSMWKSSEFRGKGGQADWFCEGIRAAEAHHGITGASK